MEGADFSGYATKAGLECSDGRVIVSDAFKHMDGMQVPLVWSHGHTNPENVLGHAILEAKDGHVYAYGFFNGTPNGQTSKALVQHKDIASLSIYANQLTEKVIGRTKQVFHGMIKEVSLVIAGANPGAKIDFITLQHSDGELESLPDEAIIHTGEELQNVELPEEDLGEVDLEHAEGKTVQDVYDSLNEEQKKLVHFMIGAAIEAAPTNSAEHSDENTEGETLTHKEGTETTMNVFEQAAGGTKTDDNRHVLTHSDLRGIMADWKVSGSMKQSIEKYALAHGITDIDMLFPDAKTISNTPEFDKRRTEWVAGVLSGTRHSPFTRIKSLVADITHDEARAKGYITGNFKKEEWFKLSKRTTSPTTVYKKQKFDRDDILDITELDLLAWVKGEMRLMLEEEIAGAILIGDGRAVDDEDKIKDPEGAQDGAGIRSILHEHELYAATVNLNIDDASSDYNEIVEGILRQSHLLKGTGSPTFYTKRQVLVEMLLSKDTFGRRRWNNTSELASAMQVDRIVPVEIMEREEDLIGIIVNLQDYTIGTDKGGETNFFDDFDIDYNQMKYLYETRLSGALTKIRSALIIKKTAGGNVLVDPVTEPTFVSATGVVTIPTQTGVVYKNADTDATLTAGAQAALDAGESLNVIAVPASGYYFFTNANDEWTFTRPAA